MSVRVTEKVLACFFFQFSPEVFDNFLSTLEVFVTQNDKDGYRAYGAALFSAITIAGLRERSSVFTFLWGNPNLGLGNTFTKGSYIFYTKMVRIGLSL